MHLHTYAYNIHTYILFNCYVLCTSQICAVVNSCPSPQPLGYLVRSSLLALEGCAQGRRTVGVLSDRFCGICALAPRSISPRFRWSIPSFDGVAYQTWFSLKVLRRCWEALLVPKLWVSTELEDRIGSAGEHTQQVLVQDSSELHTGEFHWN